MTWRAWAVFALLGAAAGVVALHAGRETLPFFDEWDWIGTRQGHAPADFLRPHNGSLSLVPVAIYKGLLAVAGLHDYWVFRVALVVAHIACAAAVLAYLQRRVGAVIALSAVAPILVLGTSADNLLWPIQLNFVGAVLFGVLALLALDRGDRRGDAAAAVALCLSVASTSIGVAFVVAVAVELALRREPRRAWVVVLPVLAYALWWLGYHDASELSNPRAANLPEVPGYVAEMAGTAVAGIAGAVVSFRAALGAGLFVVVIGAVLGLRAFTPRVAALVAAPLALWVLTGLARAQLGEPEAPRYVYAGVVMVLLLAAEIASTLELGRRRMVQAAVVVLAVAGVALNIGDLGRRGDALRDNAATLRAQLYARDLLGGAVTDDFTPAPRVDPQIQVGELRPAERSYGRVPRGPASVRGVSSMIRQEADDTLRSGQEVRRPVPAARCRRVAGIPMGTDVAVAPGTALRFRTRSLVAVSVRRFGDQPVEIGSAAEGMYSVAVAADADSTPWQIRLSAPATRCD